MPWTINAEIYPFHVRSRCIGITTAVNWICNLIVSFTFLSLTRECTTYGAFWLYAGICVFGVVYLYWKLPETKGVPLDDIEKLFQHQPPILKKLNLSFLVDQKYNHVNTEEMTEEKEGVISSL